MLTTFGALFLSTVTVTLPMEVQVSGSEVTLGEIATVEGENTELVARVEAFGLGYAPSPGYSRVIQRWQLEQRVRKEFENLDLVFDGKAACRIIPLVAVIPAEEIEKEARQSLVALFAGQDVEIRLKGELDNERVPVGLESREFSAEPTTAKAESGSWSIPVKIKIDGVPYRTIWTSFQVDLYRVMPVMKTDIAPGQIIEAADVVMQRAAVTAGARRAPLGRAALVGAEAKRLLRAGLPVAERDVRRELAIKRGETVSLIVRNGLVTVSTEVISMQDAYLGDLVPIQTFGSSKELTAKVVGARRLELSLNSGN